MAKVATGSLKWKLRIHNTETKNDAMKSMLQRRIYLPMDVDVTVLASPMKKTPKLQHPTRLHREDRAAAYGRSISSSTTTSFPTAQTAHRHPVPLQLLQALIIDLREDLTILHHLSDLSYFKLQDRTKPTTGDDDDDKTIMSTTHDRISSSLAAPASTSSSLSASGQLSTSSS